MNKKKIGIIALIIVILSSVTMVFANGIKNKQVVEKNDDKLQIVVTSFPQYDFARAVAGDNADIEMLIKPGVETHSYEPTPDDIQKIQNADLFIYNGGENDEWVDGILDSIDMSKTQTLKLEDCVTLIEEDETVGLEGVETHSHDHDHEDGEEHEDHDHSTTDIEYDEHVWTSPLNAIKIVKNINTVLNQLDEENAEKFNENAQQYIDEIKDIDSQIRDIVKNAKRKTLVFGDRFPFKYFVEEYGLDYKAAFPGCSDEMEPSAETVSYLVNFIRKENIPVVLYVELSSQKVADTLANETGTKTMCLNSAHNLTQQDFESGVTYVSIMKENIKTLKAALQ
ncbi:MAG: metal ABC transporter substrate-binding protein [Intestinibacter bartlettii]|uniref:metal ABC transporter substrate-binding protein n=1 Tax=Intestinibacter bartlettii TaxID=261299 RepID=UPI0026EF307A|nr:metal ABC transporter substrate-binding protein [Intestinibacter bartlettii]MDO5010938.1 metal ABC transporter substrate-binding protein [Intestinibacter bartlettii]